MKDDAVFLTVDDVMNILGCKRSKAYKLIRRFNRELEDLGFDTERGKVPRDYFYNKFGLLGE